MDFGEDPDDEPAFAYIWKTCRDPLLLVVCPNNKSSNERLEEFTTNYQNLLSTQPASGFMVYIMTIEDFKNSSSAGCVFNRVLICAPVRDLDPFLNAKQFYLQGSLEEKSFNTKDSELFLNFYKKRGLLVEVPTSLCSQVKPSVELLQSMVSLPQIPEGTIIGSARMAFGRIDPFNQKSNKYAESVVNPECGRGINFSNVLTLYSLVKNIDISPNQLRPLENHIDLAQRYVNDLKVNLKVLEMEEKTIEYVSKINMMLEEIFPGIWEGRERVIYSSDDIDKSLQAAIARFGSIVLSRESGVIPGTMPYYDLVAATEFSCGSLEEKFGKIVEKEGESPKLNWNNVYRHWIQVFSATSIF